MFQCSAFAGKQLKSHRNTEINVSVCTCHFQQVHTCTNALFHTKGGRGSVKVTWSLVFQVPMTFYLLSTLLDV